MSAHSQSRQTETDYHCAHGDNRSHRPLRRLGPERLLPMLRGMTLSPGERYEEFHCPGVMRLTRGSGRRHEIADRRSAPACGITGPIRRLSINQRREPGSHCPPALRMRQS